MPDSLELVLRGGAATTFLLLTVILLRDGGNRMVAYLGALFCASTAWWALNVQPFAGWSYQWALPVVAIAYGKTAAFWLFSRALFEDGFRIKAVHWAIWGAFVVFGGAWLILFQLNLPTDLARIPHQTAQIVLAAMSIWTAWKGRSADLVEPRRKARAAYIVLSGLFMIGITLSYLAPGKVPPLATDLNVIRMFLMAVGMVLLVSGLRSAEMFAAQAKTPVSIAADRPGLIVCTDPGEARLLSRLQHLMQEERVYRLEGATIGAVAAKAGVPEYALRRLINGRLGYRNFNAYLNEWRLADAKAALRDPNQRDVPISTIALDAGFSALGPFNRAFKAAEGMTPSEYRDGESAEQRASSASPKVKSA